MHRHTIGLQLDVIVRAVPVVGTVVEEIDHFVAAAGIKTERGEVEVDQAGGGLMRVQIDNAEDALSLIPH